jgi:hypothetical protein
MKDDPKVEADEMTRLLLLLVAVAKPLSLSLDPSIVPQIGEEKGLEAQRALTMTIAGLMLDVVRTTWLCAKNGAYRQLQVLDRQAFELSTRSAFYADNADIADTHWRSTNKHFIRVARKVHGEGTPDFLAFEKSVLTDDAGFSSGTNAQTSNKPNFEEMCKNVYGVERGALYYAGHYSVPSAVAHGSPAAFAYVFEQTGKGYRLRSSPGMVNVAFTLKAISQSGINAAASIAYLFRAPIVVKGVMLCEKIYDSHGFDKHLLLRRNFAI